MDKKLYELQAELCKTLSNPKRLEILDILKEREDSVFALELPPYFYDSPKVREAYAKYLAEVEHLDEQEHEVSGEISVRTADEPYRTRVKYDEAGDSWESSCNCPGWRGPTGHCKHVAAVMVALRDEVRPPRTKQPQQQQIQVRSASRTGYSDLGVNRRRVERLREQFTKAKPPG